MEIEKFRGYKAEGKEENEPQYEKVDEIWLGGFDKVRLIQGRRGPLAAATDIGIGRKKNEDALVLNTEKDGFAVIDGMGGMDYGERAAQILAEELQKGIERDTPIEEVQAAASKRMAERGVGEGGACYTAIKLIGNEAEIYRAGDVRLIIVDLATGKIRFETKDEGFGHKITNAVQGTNPGRTTKEKVEIRPQDRIYLASDGLWKNTAPEEVVKSTYEREADDALKTLYRMATEKMKKDKKASLDNITVFIYDIARSAP
mgnify:CR=1 FL=1